MRQKMGAFFIHFVTFTSNLVVVVVVIFLTLLAPPIVWDIIRFESDTLPSYRWLSNCSYTII